MSDRSFEVDVNHYDRDGNYEGMSTITIPPDLIRAFFAGCALQGLEAARHCDFTFETLAEEAWKDADAMMERPGK